MILNMKYKILYLTIINKKKIDILINETKGLYVLKGTPRSGKNFFVKYLTHYLQIHYIY